MGRERQTDRQRETEIEKETKRVDRKRPKAVWIREKQIVVETRNLKCGVKEYQMELTIVLTFIK